MYLICLFNVNNGRQLSFYIHALKAGLLSHIVEYQFYFISKSSFELSGTICHRSHQSKPALDYNSIHSDKNWTFHFCQVNWPNTKRQANRLLHVLGHFKSS